MSWKLVGCGIVVKLDKGVREGKVGDKDVEMEGVE